MSRSPLESRSERMKFLDDAIQIDKFKLKVKPKRMPRKSIQQTPLTVAEQREAFENWVNYRNLRA